MAQDDFNNNNNSDTSNNSVNFAGDLMEYLKELSSTEAEKYGAIKEPIQQYQQSQANLESSLRNINDSRSTALRDIEAGSLATEQELVNNVLGQANPLALSQAQLNVQNQKANSLRSVREKSQADVDTYNTQKEQSQRAFLDSIAYNKKFLSNAFNRVFEREEDKAWQAGTDFNANPISDMLNKYIETNFKPIWSDQDYLDFKDKIKF